MSVKEAKYVNIEVQWKDWRRINDVLSCNTKFRDRKVHDTIPLRV